MIRSRGLLFPLVLIAIGVLVLLANLGVLSSQALQRLADLWPLLLVIVGLQLILNHTLPRQQATGIGLAATALIVVAAVIYAALAPSTAFGTQHASSSEPIGGLSAGILELNYSAASVNIQSRALGDNLYHAGIEYPAGENPPTVAVDHQTGTVTISENANFGSFHLFGSSNRKLTVTLSTRIPWTIRISGGASGLQMDLRELQLTNLEINGGASSVDGHLGKPKGTLAVNISGGASNVSLPIPNRSHWRTALTRGVGRRTVTRHRPGA